MKKILFLVILLSLALTACGAATPASSSTTNVDAYVSPNLDTSYENALSPRLQLSLGSLKLAETDVPLTTRQAQVMLPLWQGLANMTSSGNSSQAEINALLGQIEAAFTPDQLTAIQAMKLTSNDIQTWAASAGVSTGSGTSEGMGQGGGQGGGSGLSPEARATKQAEEGVVNPTSGGGGGVSTLMLNALIDYLQELASQ